MKYLQSTSIIKTNDIDLNKRSEYHFDALNFRNYQLDQLRNIKNVISSPPDELLLFSIGLFVKQFDIIVVHYNTSECDLLRNFYLKSLTRHFDIYKIKATDSISFLIILRGKYRGQEIITL